MDFFLFCLFKRNTFVDDNFAKGTDAKACFEKTVELLRKRPFLPPKSH